MTTRKHDVKYDINEYKHLIEKDPERSKRDILISLYGCHKSAKKFFDKHYDYEISTVAFRFMDVKGRKQTKSNILGDDNE